MKRSEINASIRWAEELCRKYHITLPDFSRFAPSKKEMEKPERSNIVKTMLGWDITDFGSGDFSRCGAVLFTVRNGNVYEPSVGTPYAEKYIFLKDGNEQEIPMHYHIRKTEDIINRAGGILCVQVYAKGEDGKIDETQPVVLYRDGERYEATAGEVIEITNGNSITLTPYVYHRFYTKKGTGDLIIGEVSKINDDNLDNVFANPQERFCAIEEDEPKYRLLVNEYREE